MRAVATILAMLAAALPCGAEVAHTVDGRRVEGALLAVEGGQVVLRTRAGEQKLAVGDVRSVGFAAADAPDVMNVAGQHVLVGDDGTRLAVRDATVADGKVSAATGFAPSITVSLEAVHRLLRPRSHEKPSDLDRQREAMKLAAGDKDILLVSTASGGWTALSGILNSIGKDQVQLSYEGNDTELPAQSVPVVQVAKVKAVEPAAAAGLLVCTDGSQLAFTTIKSDGKALAVACAMLPGLRLDPGKVASIRFHGSARIALLSDLSPAAVKQTPFFDESFTWRKDRAVSGGPLKINGTTFERGLGLHARCELQYDLSGQYKQLTAMAGIDDSVPAGSAVLRIVGDGKTLVADMPLDAGVAARPIRIDVSGVRALTIIADFAPGTFGAGARVNLGDAVLTR